MSGKPFGSCWRAMEKRAGISMTSLERSRHTFATHYCEGGTDLAECQTMFFGTAGISNPTANYYMYAFPAAKMSGEHHPRPR